MIFHEKNFQCVAGAIPLFLTPQKICLLKSCVIFKKRGLMAQKQGIIWQKLNQYPEALL